MDLEAFEEILIFYRGATTITERRRDPLKAYIGWKEVKIPVFQRLFLLFKLKPFEERVREVMQEQKIDRNDAERQVKRMRGMLPATVSSDYVYLKLFKNLPRSDVEMIFPNTKVKFRLFDKIKFGVTAGGGLGMGVFGTASKIALLTTNPIAFAGALVGLGGVAARQASNFVAQRNRYMVVMAQNLYFHAMADNRGVVTLLADRAAEEDVKEEMLLYSVLAKAPANIARSRPSRSGDRAVPGQDLQHRCRFRRRRCPQAAEGGWHRHRAARRHAAGAAPAAGGPAHRQALGCLSRPAARYRSGGGPGSRNGIRRHTECLTRPPDLLVLEAVTTSLGPLPVAWLRIDLISASRIAQRCQMLVALGGEILAHHGARLALLAFRDALQQPLEEPARLPGADL